MSEMAAQRWGFVFNVKEKAKVTGKNSRYCVLHAQSLRMGEKGICADNQQYGNKVKRWAMKDKMEEQGSPLLEAAQKGLSRVRYFIFKDDFWTALRLRT